MAYSFQDEIIGLPGMGQVDTAPRAPAMPGMLAHAIDPTLGGGEFVYGSGIAGSLDRGGSITCPVLFHFGGQDPYIPREQVDQVAAFAASHPDMECHVQDDAGHAFDNHEAPMFHQPEPAARAWEITRDFLGRAFPT